MFFWISKSQTSPFWVFKVKLISLSSLKSYFSLPFLTFSPMMERLHSKSPFVVESFSVVGIICPKMTFSFLDSFVFGVRQKNKNQNHNDFQRCLFVWRKRSRLNWKRLFLHRTNFGVLLHHIFSFFERSNIKNFNSNKWKKFVSKKIIK